MSKAWWRAALIRCLRTLGQTLAAGLSALLVAHTSNLMDIDWQGLVSVAVLATLFSLATSLAGLPEVDANTTYKPDNYR